MSYAAPRSPVVAAFVLVFCLWAGAAQAADAGSVVGLGGQVALERDGQRYSLQLGAAVYVGDTVTVPAGGKLRLRMRDGSMLSLAGGTSMRIDDYSVDATGRRQRAGVSIGGGLLHSLTSGGDRPASFEVNTAVGVSGVRSTDWFVEALPGADQVAVLHGSVALTSLATRRSVVIPAGMGSRLEAGADPTPPQVLNPAEFAALAARTDGSAPPPASPGPAPPPNPPGGYYPPPAPYPPVYPPGGYYPPPAPYPPLYPPGGYYPPRVYMPLPLPVPQRDGSRRRPDHRHDHETDQRPGR